MRRLAWHLSIVLASLTANAHTTQAVEVAGGLAAVEEGDDRLRPGATYHLGFTPEIYLRGYFYGRSYGPVSERTDVVSLNYRFPVYGKKTGIVAGMGGVLLLESTEVKATSDDESDDKADQYNFGWAAGISYEVPMGTVYMSFNWDAHLFFAGSAGIFLATGRKQMISVATGMKI